MSEFFYRQLAKAAQKEAVEAGEQIAIKVDLALAHDGSGPEILKLFQERSLTPAAGCSRVVVTLDHAFPAPTVAARQFQQEIAEFAEKYNFRLYKNGEGVLHQVIAEEESLWPGMMIVGADGHVATAGAFGAIAFSLSAAKFVDAVSSGTCDLTVPDKIVVSLEGDPQAQVMARDIAMHMAANHGPEIKDRAVLLTGSAIDRCNISEKMSICNYLPEAGVTTALVLPQGEHREIDLTVDVSTISPMIAIPGPEPLYVRPSSLDQPITVAIAGGCSSGRLDDMKVIADILAKREVHPEVTFIITPGSKNVLESMDKLNISAILRNAGAIIMPPGCGPCPGKHFGVLSDRDVAVTTTIRNTPGRMGARKAKIFLTSPLTVAMSAVHGKITEP